MAEGERTLTSGLTEGLATLPCAQRSAKKQIPSTRNL